MPISGWVITLDAHAAQQEAALEVLHADPRITPGERSGLRLPVVLETSSVAEDTGLVEQLRAVGGIAFIDLVFVDFSDVDTADRGWRPQGRRGCPVHIQDGLEEVSS